MSLLDELKELVRKHDVTNEQFPYEVVLKRPPHVLVETEEIKTSRILSLSKGRETKSYIIYNPQTNTVTIIFDEYDTNDMTVVHNIDDNYALLYRYEDMELVGLRIEGVEREKT